MDAGANHMIMFGNIIKQRRKQLKIAQDKLVELGRKGKICDVKHLREIEKGRAYPSPYILDELLYALSFTMEDFTSRVYGDDWLEFQNSSDEVSRLFFDEKYKEARIKFNELKNSPHYDPDNPLMKQAMCFYEGVLFSGIEKDNDKSMAILLEALCMTYPALINKSGDIDCIELSSNVLSRREYSILNSIATVKSKMKQHSAAIDIYKALKISMSTKKIDSRICQRKLPTIYFNLSNLLLKECRYQEAFEVCEEGIVYIYEVSNYKVLGEMLCNKGRAFHYMGDSANALIYFKKSYDLFILHGKPENAEFLKQALATDYNVFI